MPNQLTASLWGDEAFSAILSLKSVGGIISTIIKDTSPPLYNITEHLWFQIFGTSEIAIRLLSLFYYSIAVFFVYKIGSYLWDRRTGVLAALFSFLNPFFFTYAFEGRMYSILAMGVTASMYFFIRLAAFGKNTSGKKARIMEHNHDIVGYIVATTIALYSHHFAIFAVFVQGFWFLWELFSGKRQIAKRMFIAFMGTALLYTPWLIPLYKQTKMVGGGFWLGTPTLTDLINLIAKFLARGVPHALDQIALIFVAIILVLRRYRDDMRRSIFLASWFLLPIVLTWIVSQKFQSIFFDRYMLYTIPGAMLLLTSRARKLATPLLVSVLAMFVIIDVFSFTHPIKRPFRELATYVKSVQQPGDVLLNWNAGSHHLWESKYYGIPAPIYVSGSSELPFFVGTALMEKDDITRTVPPAKRIGVITSDAPESVILPGYTPQEVHSFGDLHIIWLTKQIAQPPTRARTGGR